MNGRRTVPVLIMWLVVSVISGAASNLSDKNKIARQAEIFIKKKHAEYSDKYTSWQTAEIQSLYDISGNKLPAYVVHINPQGFLIIAEQSNSLKVIAYSFSQSWSTKSSTNSGFLAFLAKDLERRGRQQSQRRESLISGHKLKSSPADDINEGSPGKFYQWPADESTVTGGWLQTTWIQGSPYKDFCPKDSASGENFPVGCVATALAQVVNYHKYIGSLKFSGKDTYTTLTNKINIDADSTRYEFPGFGQLNGYLEKVRIKYQNNQTLDKEELAALNFACGISLKIDYTAGASALRLPKRQVATVLKQNLGYASAEFIWENDKFYQILIENLMNGLPALIYLSDHAIVADGYKTSGEFHLNFGWQKGDPAPITQAWYCADGLPKNYDCFECGILNLNPYPVRQNSQICPSDSILRLPGTRVGAVSGAKAFTLTNTGETPVKIDDILSSRNFFFGLDGKYFDNNIQAVTLQPGEELNLYIRCVPDRSGQMEGVLQVLASYQDQKKYLAIELVGCGVPGDGSIVNTENISGNWKKEESPYYICRDISIPAGEDLKINPGTEIIFLGPFQFSVEENARLVAAGVESDSVYFRSSDSSGGWRGIRFISSGADDILAYAVVQDGNTGEGEAVIYIDRSSPLITHSKISKNRSTFQGGALYLYRSESVITYTYVEKNICYTDTGASALYIDHSTPLLANVVISNNHSISGGTICASHSAARFLNCTIAGNIAQSEGAAFFLKGENRFQIKNSILWGNEAKSGFTLAFRKTPMPDTVSFNYSDVDTTSLYWLYSFKDYRWNKYIYWEEGNLCEDPLFKSPQNNDYTLQVSSPCIDAGDPEDDVGEEPHPDGSRINMGAYGGTTQAAILSSIQISVPGNRQDFHLSQNYPNPFNPSTSIEFTLPQPEYTTIKIYNILGEYVANLVSETLRAGLHTCTIDGSKMASGVYFYEVTAGEFRDVKKMILLR